MADSSRTPDHRDVTLQSMDDYGSQLTCALQDLSLEEARWMPTPKSNHVLWILWHMGRMEDMWGWYLRGEGDSAWIEGGWADRLGIDPSRSGSGDTIEPVQNFPDVTVEEVTAYWQASRELLIPSIEGVTVDRLDETRPEIWPGAPDTAPTLLWALGRIPVENGQHTGQIACIRGLYAAKFRQGFGRRQFFRRTSSTVILNLIQDLRQPATNPTPQPTRHWQEKVALPPTCHPEFIFRIY